VRHEKGRERTLQEIHSTLDEHTAAVDTGGTAESDHKHRTIVSACFVSMLPTGASVAIPTGSKCWQKSDRTPQIAKYDRIWDRFCPKKSIQIAGVFARGWDGGSYANGPREGAPANREQGRCGGPGPTSGRPSIRYQLPEGTPSDHTPHTTPPLHILDPSRKRICMAMTLNFDVMVCVCLCPRVVFVLQGKVKFRHLRELEPLHVPRPTTATVRCQTPVRIWMCCVNLCVVCLCGRGSPVVYQLCDYSIFRTDPGPRHTKPAWVGRVIYGLLVS
jgi:hypothetical protein